MSPSADSRQPAVVTPQSAVDGRRSPVAGSRGPALSMLASSARVFDLSLGQMLWSRRSVFLGLLLGGPVLLAAAIRIVTATTPFWRFSLNGARVGGPGLFGMMMWLLYIRFIVPVLGVFYGTALIADEVEDKTITYLFTRPVRRGAVLHREVPGVSRLYHAPGAAVGRARLLSDRAAWWRKRRRVVPGPARRPRDAGRGPGRIRRRVRLGGRPAATAAGHRPRVRVGMGAGRAAVSGLSQASDGGLLPSGARARMPCRRIRRSAC